MADHEHAILLTEREVLDRRVEIVNAGLWMHSLPLQHVLGADCVELCFDESRAACIESRKLIRIERRTYPKRATKGVLERRRRRRTRYWWMAASRGGNERADRGSQAISPRHGPAPGRV